MIVGHTPCNELVLQGKSIRLWLEKCLVDTPSLLSGRQEFYDNTVVSNCQSKFRVVSRVYLTKE